MRLAAPMPEIGRTGMMNMRGEQHWCRLRQFADEAVTDTCLHDGSPYGSHHIDLKRGFPSRWIRR
jgi:hypothetical protein